MNGTTFLFVRHASTETTGTVLTGRLPGVSLSAAGRDEALGLGDRLAAVSLAALYASPLERAIETAAAIGARQNLPVEPAQDLLELDAGDWTGLRFEDLASRDDWQRFNQFRVAATAPGGERMLDVQARVVRFVDRLTRRHGDAAVALVTHADVIRAALTCFAGVPLDLFYRFEIAVASVTAVRVAGRGAHVLCVNHTADLAWLTSRGATA